MDESEIRTHADALCAALVDGDIGRATEDFSPELRRNLGEVVALLPLPATAAAVDSVEKGGSATVVTIRIDGESEQVVIQTRWKERDGRPVIVEASHLSRLDTAAPGTDEGPSEDVGDGPA